MFLPLAAPASVVVPTIKWNAAFETFKKNGTILGNSQPPYSNAKAKRRNQQRIRRPLQVRQIAPAVGAEKTQMCDGARGDGGEADCQGVVPLGLGEASESVPYHMFQAWADLPHRARQRSR